MIRSVRDIDITDKKVFIRCDFNVPLDEFMNITDDRRIRSAIQTIRYCLDHNCTVIVASHLGRPKGVFESKYSLSPVFKRLTRILNCEVLFSSDVIGIDAKQKVENLKNGEVLLLENLRFEKGETKNDVEFAKELASYADIYINDAFGVCHRAHASVEAVTKYFDEETSAAGFLLQKEVNFSKNLLKSPTRPFVAVVGGSKVSGKLQALINLLPRIDKLIIGGAMSNTFLKALGYDMQNSLYERDYVQTAKDIIEQTRQQGVKLYLPVDVVITDSVDHPIDIKVVPSQDILEGFGAVDIGPATVKLFSEAIGLCNTIIWNGPMGIYEVDKFSRGTFKIANTIADSYAYTIVGGGDTADAVYKAREAENFSFISTGGGASLELLEGKILPGFEKLNRKEES